MAKRQRKTGRACPVALKISVYGRIAHNESAFPSVEIETPAVRPFDLPDGAPGKFRRSSAISNTSNRFITSGHIALWRRSRRDAPPYVVRRRVLRFPKATAAPGGGALEFRPVQAPGPTLLRVIKKSISFGDGSSARMTQPAGSPDVGRIGKTRNSRNLVAGHAPAVVPPIRQRLRSPHSDACPPGPLTHPMPIRSGGTAEFSAAGESGYGQPSAARRRRGARRPAVRVEHQRRGLVPTV